MTKRIIKEIFIAILILIAIVLAIGVVFYDYIPNNKVIPVVEAYQTPKEVKNELEEEIVKEEEKVLVTYEITANDLKQFEKQGDYDKGKANPFALYQESTLNDKTQSNNKTPSNNTGSSINNNNNSNNSTNKNKPINSGTFYNNTSTK